MPNDTEVKKIETMDDIFEDLMTNDVFGSIAADFDPQGILMTPEQYEEKYGGEKANRNKYHALDGEITAVQQVCHNYADYEHLINKALSDTTTLDYHKTCARKNDIVIGSVVVFKGVLGVVVDINASEERSSGQSSRAHIVFANKTESHLLLSTIVSNTYKDFSYLVQFYENCA